MGIQHTGNAEIDQQHAILESMVEQLRQPCSASLQHSDADCAGCAHSIQQDCRNTLEGMTTQLAAFLVGHATYEERMMELLPDTPICQTHIKGHKAAHEGIARQLKRLATEVHCKAPRTASVTLWQLLGDWLGDHAVLFDNRLVRLGKSVAPEIDFDAELVAMLDQHVFPNRPTTASLSGQLTAQRDKLEMRGRFELLTAAQRKVFWFAIAGRKNAEIATELGISVNTVKTHRSAIFQKFEVSSLIELVKKTNVLR
jgi:DNA-binding CsgD family transcriptional regulator/hemerythrin